MENKKTYKDLNLPNPTIRSSFLPAASIIDDVKKTTYIFDAPYFLDKSIEFIVTNYSGYSKEVETDGEIPEEFLWDYLISKEQFRKYSLDEFSESQIYNTIGTIKYQEDLLRRIPSKEDTDGLEIKIDAIEMGVKELIEERNRYKANAEFYESNSNIYEKLYRNLLKKKKSKGLFSRLFNL